MKLRMRGNTLRLRLTRSEVALLVEQGSVSEDIAFGNDAALTYELRSRADVDGIGATFANNTISVFVPQRLAREWAGTERVGMDSMEGALAILIEKDFQCTHGETDPDAF